MFVYMKKVSHSRFKKLSENYISKQTVCGQTFDFSLATRCEFALVCTNWGGMHQHKVKKMFQLERNKIECIPGLYDSGSYMYRGKRKEERDWRENNRKCWSFWQVVTHKAHSHRLGWCVNWLLAYPYS